MPIQRRTAGSGEMSPTTNPTAIAPYHHSNPMSRRASRAIPARPAGTGIVWYEGRVLAAGVMTVVTTNDAATAVPAPARYSHNGTGSWNVPPMACAATGNGVAIATTSNAAAAAKRELRFIDREDVEADALGVLVGVELDRELAAADGREGEL